MQKIQNLHVHKRECSARENNVMAGMYNNHLVKKKKRNGIADVTVYIKRIR